MKKLWQDIARHRGAAALYLVYWLATVVMVPLMSDGGISDPVVALLLSNSLIPCASPSLNNLWRMYRAPC